MTDHKPEITKRGFLSMQVCVPEGWTDEQINEWLVSINELPTADPSPEGLRWRVMSPEEYAKFSPDPIRVPCKERAGYIHTIVSC